MTEVFRFSVLGLGAGGLYALAAVGLVLVYRGSGVINFAQAAMGMAGAYVYYEAHVLHGLPDLAALAVALAGSAALGAVFHLLVMRRLREASALVKVVATLALLVVLQGIAAIRYGELPRVVPSMLPTGPVKILGASVGADRIWIFILVIVLTTGLWFVYKFTTFGVATTAVAESPQAAAALGVSPTVIAAANWAVGAALGGLAAIFLAPITGLGSSNLTFLVIPVLAAAVVGRFSSFPLTTLAGLLIGIAQSLVTLYVTAPGWGTAVPFIFVTIYLIARGRAVAGKDERFARMPALGTGKLAPGLIVVGAGAALVCIWWAFPPTWVEAVQVQLIVVIVLLSFVVVTGLAGQVSLAQMGFAGVGALIASWLAAGHGWPFELALLAGVLAAIPVGVVIGLAGIRARGVSLAIVTLGLAVSLEAVVFDNPQYTGGITGWQETNLTFFGISVSPSAYPARYATLSLIVVVLVGLAVANLRRGRAGRRLIAVRTNERAAASLGVSVLGAKLYAFVLGAMIAALGGVLLAFSQPVLAFGNFAAINSVLDTQYAVLGGVGTVGGPLAGSGLAPGTLGQTILSFLGGNVAIILGIVAGGGLLALLVFAPDGVAVLTRDLNDWWLSRLRLRLPGRRVPDPTDDTVGGDPQPVPPMALRVTDLTVRFGGTTALDRLNLTIHPGEVVGLIGPNGAGKSTAIEAITGFVSPAAGTIMLGDHRIDGWTRERRARAGLSRSFQTLELFDDLTVLENILAASDPRDLAAYVTDLVKPGTGRLTPAARRAITDFGLRDVLPAKVLNLSYAERRTLAVARAVAGGQSVLLLDEPASGLDLGAWRQLSRTIRGLASDRGVAILLVEHNVDMVLQTCDRIWALDFGQTIACGTPAEIRTDPAVISAYLGTKRSEQADPLHQEPNQPSGSVS